MEKTEDSVARGGGVVVFLKENPESKFQEAGFCLVGQ